MLGGVAAGKFLVHSTAGVILGAAVGTLVGGLLIDPLLDYFDRRLARRQP